MNEETKRKYEESWIKAGYRKEVRYGTPVFVKEGVQLKPETSTKKSNKTTTDTSLNKKLL